MLESIVSGHKINLVRPRLDEKLEIVRFDPWSKFLYKVNIQNCIKIDYGFFFLVRTMCVYKEKKKVRSI